MYSLYWNIQFYSCRQMTTNKHLADKTLSSFTRQVPGVPLLPGLRSTAWENFPVSQTFPYVTFLLQFFARVSSKTAISKNTSRNTRNRE
jgi:hypothetical protein